MQAEKITFGSFCDRFSHLISKKGVSYKELSLNCGLSSTAIVNYKRDRIPKAEELLRIARYLDVSMEWLLTGVDNNQSSDWQRRALLAEGELKKLRGAVKILIATVAMEDSEDSEDSEECDK